MNVIFFGTSNVALPVLEFLNSHHRVNLVVTTPDAPVGKKQILSPSPVSVLAEELHLKIIKPEKVKNNPEILNTLSEYQADIFVVVSYGKILPIEIIDLPKFKTINIHFSLLPKYRGASPIQAALLSGDSVTGISIFSLTAGMDVGPILSQEQINIDPDDNFITLSEKSAHASIKLLEQTLNKIQSGRVKQTPQEESLATYCKIIEKTDGQINWQKTSQEIYNQFRAYYPWPGIFTQWKNTNLKILNCIPVKLEDSKKIKPGTVMSRGIIACGNQTFLEIFELQLAGKKPTKIKDFLNGNISFIGSELN